MKNRIYEIFSFEYHGRPDFQERWRHTIMGGTSIYYLLKDIMTKAYIQRVIPKEDKGIRKGFRVWASRQHRLR